MKNRPLDHALEPRGRRRIPLVLGLERLVLLIEVLPHDLGEIAKFDATGLHHGRRVGIVDQCEQKMFQRRILVAALRRMGERGMQRFFEALGETWHLGHFRWSW
jgi:hypothetical protein